MHMPACLHQLEIIELNALDDALGAEKFKVKEGKWHTCIFAAYVRQRAKGVHSEQTKGQGEIG